jgi:hypothetical protein
MHGVLQDPSQCSTLQLDELNPGASPCTPRVFLGKLRNR